MTGTRNDPAGASPGNGRAVHRDCFGWLCQPRNDKREVRRNDKREVPRNDKREVRRNDKREVRRNDKGEVRRNGSASKPGTIEELTLTISLNHHIILWLPRPAI
ncbi:MAG: hypothetical protein ACLFVA_05060 [Dehalococcoidia bacterium]